MDKLLSPQEVVDRMYHHDAFSQWLGIERLEERLGYSKVRMTVRKEMLNGFHIAHGGITFSLADSAFAFASNGHGRHAVSIDCNINHLQVVREHDVLTAEARQVSHKRTQGLYLVEVTNQNGDLVALFKGMVSVRDTVWK